MPGEGFYGRKFLENKYFFENSLKLTENILIIINMNIFMFIIGLLLVYKIKYLCMNKKLANFVLGINKNLFTFTKLKMR